MKLGRFRQSCSRGCAYRTEYGGHSSRKCLLTSGMSFFLVSAATSEGLIFKGFEEGISVSWQ